MSPLTRKNGSVSDSGSRVSAPAVPSGSSSRTYRMRTPSRAPSPKYVSIISDLWRTVTKNSRHAGRPQPLDEDLEQRLAAHAQQWLGHVVGERAQAAAVAAGHQHRRVRHRDRAQEVVEQQDVDEPAGGIDHRKVTESALLHERERLGARDAGRRRDRLAVHQLGDAAVDGDPAEEAAPDVAVGDDADQAPARRPPP